MVALPKPRSIKAPFQPRYRKNKPVSLISLPFANPVLNYSRGFGWYRRHCGPLRQMPRICLILKQRLYCLDLTGLGGGMAGVLCDPPHNTQPRHRKNSPYPLATPPFADPIFRRTWVLAGTGSGFAPVGFLPSGTTGTKRRGTVGLEVNSEVQHLAQGCSSSGQANYGRLFCAPKIG
jgi:hypothetical protein